MRVILFLALALLTNCTRNSDPNAPINAAADKQPCALPSGDYVAQSVVHEPEAGVYRAVVLGAPACVQQPVAFAQLKLARLEDGDKEKARLKVVTSDDASLFMAADFQIQLVEHVKQPDGTLATQTSSWSPFLAGAAGMVVGGLVGGALARSFSQPRYYTPPAPAPGGSGGVVRGFGGAGDTREAAVRSYQRKTPAATDANFPANAANNKGPAPAAPTAAAQPQNQGAKKSFFKTSSRPRASGGFFRKRR